MKIQFYSTAVNPKALLNERGKIMPLMTLSLTNKALKITYIDTEELNTFKAFIVNVEDVSQVKYTHFEDGSVLDIVIKDKFQNTIELCRDSRNGKLIIKYNDETRTFASRDYHAFFDDEPFSYVSFKEKDWFVDIKDLFF